jgi:DNA-binding FadR family transcriptional regulator
LKEHTAIVAAISRGEDEQARTLTREHLYVTEVLLRQFFESRTAKPRDQTYT